MTEKKTPKNPNFEGSNDQNQGDDGESSTDNVVDFAAEASKKQEDQEEHLEEKPSPLQEMTDKYFRTVAELENISKRHDRQLSEVRKFASEALLKDLLPVLDSFDQGLSGQLNDGSSREFVEGMQLVKELLTKVLAKHGLKQVETVDKAFDPNYHQAIKRVDAGDGDQEYVSAEFQKGYVLNGRLVRAAMVEVTVGHHQDHE